MSESTAGSTPTVLIYATGWCPYCSRARALLDGKGVKYEEIDIEKSAGARTQMQARSGGRTSVPQIFVGDTHVGGCDDLMALEARGALDPLLGRGAGQSS